MKNIKTFESFSKIYENSGEKTTQEVIKNINKCLVCGIWQETNITT